MAMAIAESRATVFCALETDLYPHAVLLKGGAARVRAPVRFRFGRGAAHVNRVRPAPYGTEQKQASHQSGGLGEKSLQARVRSMTQGFLASRA